MASTNLKERVAALEDEIARLKAAMTNSRVRPWWERIAGTLPNDRVERETARLGRTYREARRSKRRKPHQPDHAGPGH